MRRITLSLSLLLVTLSGCECATSEGSLDAAGLDASASDADSTTTDAGEVDAAEAPFDAGRSDAGLPDERVCETLEICNDGLDADCDGRVDEGCVCAPGESQACFRGDPRHRGVGGCRDGTMLCANGFEFGEWDPCEGDVLEAEEVCDAAGADEDCDGAANDGCECAEGDADLPCGTDTGECAAGFQRCVMGMRTDCEGAIDPAVEVCDGLDQDCDGSVDEGMTRACGSGVGVCRMGSETCVDGVWGACLGGAMSSDERCDGLDNDCDGSPDEDVTRTCGIDVGRCVAGLETCTGGTYGTCEGRVEPIDETCNDVDDDCDGSTDEDLTRPCGTSVGVCEEGRETCSSGAWGSCIGGRTPGLEVCDGVEDESCNGTVDEGCACIDGEVRACGTNLGVCSFGSQTCDTTGQWGTCVGAVEPGNERCDGSLDEDCDGVVDEGCECVTGATRGCGVTGVGECALGVETCDAMGRWGTCVGAVGSVPEDCNGLDDDCDTNVDEGGVCPTFPPSATCPAGVTTLTGTTVTLGGAGSDPDGGSVTYAWSVSAAPVGSTAAPTPGNTASTQLTPDLPGTYRIRLCVTDDEAETTCCTVTVTATPRCTPPTAPTLTVCPTSWDRRPVVQFNPLPAGASYELFLDGSSYATVTSVGQNYHRPASAVGVGAAPPGVEAQIFARACSTSDPTCCSVSASVRVNLIEECTTPVDPTASNIAFSEYVVNGDGPCPGEGCEAGEAIEITNLGHCPVRLSNHHFGYCNPSSCSAYRWMDFGPADIVPPRGVYVAIRNRAASMCDYPFFGPDDPGLFGLLVSGLSMEGSSLASGWFANSGGGMSAMRIATGMFVDISTGTTLELVSPYSGSAPECSSIGFDAVGECGEISPVATPTEVLTPNQLGRLWHPCDAVTSPVPASCM